MTSILLRNISFHARRIRLSHTFKSSPSILSLYKPTSFFSSSSDPPPSTIPHAHEKNQQNQQSLDDLEDISNEELKRRVARLREGDDDAIPEVFEAVLQRYLMGKPIDADQDLMRDILGKGTESKDDDEVGKGTESEDDDDEENEDEFDSDSEEMSDSDFEEEEAFNRENEDEFDSDSEEMSDSDFEEEEAFNRDVKAKRAANLRKD